MTHKEILLSPTEIFYYVMMSMLSWISLERESCWIWNLKTSSSQCHNIPVLVPPRKPPDHVKDIYDGQTYDLKTRVDILTRMDVFPVEYGTFDQTFHLTMWFFSLLIWLTSSVIMCCGVLLLCCYGLVFGPNWEFIECLHTQSDGIVKFLYFYGDH